MIIYGCHETENRSLAPLCSGGGSGRGCIGGSGGSIETAQLRTVLGMLDELGDRVLFEGLAKKKIVT